LYSGFAHQGKADLGADRRDTRLAPFHPLRVGRAGVELVSWLTR
jgi:hypothetical protein